MTLRKTLPVLAFLAFFPWSEGFADSANQVLAPDQLVLPANPVHPLIAATPAELARLRAAWAADGPEHQLLAYLVEQAETYLKKPVVFPPRGGQHNQWYQCEKCQTPLQTVDDTHHQCPVCGKVYSGEPYDDVIFSRRHDELLEQMNRTAWMWAVTRRPEFAEFAAQILLGYADRYRSYPYHANTKDNLVWKMVSGGHLFEQTLSEAYVMATCIAPAYDLIYTSPALDPDKRAKIETGLFRPLLENVDKYQAGVNNWQTWHNASLFLGGAVLHDPVYMKKAIFDGGEGWGKAAVQSWLSNWDNKGLKKAGNGFLFQMANSITPDGMWYENSWGYHFYALSALTITAEAARRLGLDLWQCEPLRRMCLLPAQFTMPDGFLPRFGDDVHSTACGHDDSFEPAWAALHDPVLLPLLPPQTLFHNVLYGRDVAAKPAGGLQPLASTLWRNSGYAVLRTGGAAGLTSVLTLGPYGGFHGHLDKLSFVFFGYGRELGVDPGRAASQAYRLTIHENWYKATLSHNTLLVDGQSQEGTDGQLNWFQAGDDTLTAVSASCDSAWSGVRFRRTLAQTPDYLIVLDDVTAEKEHEFTWCYHNTGKIAESAQTPATGVCAKNLAGGEYLQQVKTGNTDQPVEVVYVGGEVTVRLLATGAPGTTMLTGDGPFSAIADRVPLALLTRNGKQVRFTVVLEPVPAKGTGKVKGIAVSETAAGLEITVTKIAGPEERFILLPDGIVRR